MSNFYVGTQKPKSIYVGTSKVKALYLGTEKVWELQQGRLPSGYQEVEWLQSDGNSWIQTDIVLGTSYNTFEFSTQVNAPSSVTGESACLGRQTPSANLSIEIYIKSSNACLWWHNANMGRSISGIACAYDTWHDVSIYSNYSTPISSITVDGVTKSANYNFTLDTSSVAPKFKLFNYKTDKYKYYGKMKESIFKKDGVIVGDFVPCYKTSNNEIGMYDLITNTFYGNAGTGSFTKGGDV